MTMPLPSVMVMVWAPVQAIQPPPQITVAAVIAAVDVGTACACIARQLFDMPCGHGTGVVD
jgi:hypothetical protein